jgi:hypothetical protein
VENAKQSQKTDKGWSSKLGVGLQDLHHKEVVYLEYILKTAQQCELYRILNAEIS